MNTMKFHITFLALLFFAFCRSVSAQTMPYDSLAVDSLVGASATNATNIEGPSDGKQATLDGSSSFIAGMFAAGTQVVTFQKGAEMRVYWIRETTDTAAADIEFVTFNLANLALARQGPTVHVIEDGPLNILHETTLTVPDTGYNALQITIGADTGGSICWIDAITLIQSGVAAVSEPATNSAPLITGYPNPFEHGSMATLEISSSVAGRGKLAIYDALGREIERVGVGPLNPGSRQSVQIRLDHAGIFFARLIVDGAPMGAPFKLIAE